MDHAGNDAAVDGVLAHYGVRGMKWGVRRSANQLARAAASRTADNRSEDAKTAASISAKVGRKGDLSQLSNAEIQLLSTRINMEQNYARLTAAGSSKDKGRVAAGKAFATTLAADIAKEQIRRVAKEAVNSKVNEAALKKGLILDKKGYEKAQKAAKKAAEEAVEKERAAAAKAVAIAKEGDADDD